MLQREESGTRLKKCAAILGNKKIRKLRRNCGGSAFLVPCLGAQHVVETPFPAIPLVFFSREIWQPSLTNTMKGFIRINTEWKKKIQWQMERRYVG
jgi:hypothetical protein